jgi:hypothetical protein
MTQIEAAAMPVSVGRKKQWKERFWAVVPEGTVARIDAALKTGEPRTQFVRDAIERELKRREKAKEKKADEE